jgi:hypothetical protein
MRSHPGTSVQCLQFGTLDPRLGQTYSGERPNTEPFHSSEPSYGPILVPVRCSCPSLYINLLESSHCFLLNQPSTNMAHPQHASSVPTTTWIDELDNVNPTYVLDSF